MNVYLIPKIRVLLMASKTLGLEPLRKHIAYCLYSGFVENKPQPLSTLIIAYGERGKSTEARRFEMLGVKEVQDLSSAGILTELKNMTSRERHMFHHIVIPDLEKVAERSKRLKGELLATIRILQEEGLRSSLVRGYRFEFDPPAKIAFIMCTTPEDLGDKRSVFRSYSFLSRNIPFTYDYSNPHKIRILEFLEKEENVLAKNKKYLQREEAEVVKCPPHYEKELTPYAMVCANEVNKVARTPTLRSAQKRQRTFGVRFKRDFITYLKSIALYDGYSTVRKEHFAEFKRLYEFMNFDFSYID